MPVNFFYSGLIHKPYNELRGFEFVGLQVYCHLFLIILSLGTLVIVRCILIMQTDPIGSLISCGLFIINVEDVFEPSDNLPSKEVGEDSHQHGVEEGYLKDGVGDDTWGNWVGADGGGIGVT